MVGGDFTAILNTVAEDRQLVTYRPRIVALTDSVLASVLLSQMLYWWMKGGRKPFYKFRQHCKHKDYKPGDSWCEELEWNTTEFDNALRVIGTKIVKGMSKKDMLETDMPTRAEGEGDEDYCKRLETAVSRIVIYWTDSNRVTHYQVNENLLGKLLSAIYLDKSLGVRYLKKCIASVTQKNRRSQDTFSTETTPETNTETTKENAPQSAATEPSNIIPFQSKEELPDQIAKDTPPDLVAPRAVRVPSEWQKLVGLCMETWSCERGLGAKYAQMLAGKAKGDSAWAQSKLTTPTNEREFKGWVQWIKQGKRELPNAAWQIQESFTTFRKSVAYEDAIRDANEPAAQPEQLPEIDLEAAAASRARKDAMVQEFLSKHRIGAKGVNLGKQSEPAA